MGDRLQTEVAIVGAGPTGSTAALGLLARGVKDVLLLDSHDFPRDKTCASGLSPRAIEIMQELGVWADAVAPMAYPVNALRIVTPGGYDAVVSAGVDAAAAICLRRHFDDALRESAVKRGARFVPRFRAKEGLVDGAGRWRGVRAADGTEVDARYVVVATGAHSALSSDPSRKRALHTIMGWWEDIEFRPNTVEMLWDDLIAPCYGWLFPETAERVNIGITYDDDDKEKNARALFARFLDKHYSDRLAGARQVGGLRGFPIVYTYRSGRLATPGRFIAGEAGRLTHPATGEGISQGMDSALYAADAIARIREGRTSEPRELLRYDRRCARRFMPSFWMGRAFRGALRTPMLDWVVRASNMPAVQKRAARFLSHF